VLASAVLTMIVPAGPPAAPAMDTVAINGSGVPEKNKKEELTYQLTHVFCTEKNTRIKLF